MRISAADSINFLLKRLDNFWILVYFRRKILIKDNFWISSTFYGYWHFTIFSNGYECATHLIRKFVRVIETCYSVWFFCLLASVCFIITFKTHTLDNNQKPHSNNGRQLTMRLSSIVTHIWYCLQWIIIKICMFNRVYYCFYREIDIIRHFYNLLSLGFYIYLENNPVAKQNNW